MTTLSPSSRRLLRRIPAPKRVSSQPQQPDKVIVVGFTGISMYEYRRPRTTVAINYEDLWNFMHERRMKQLMQKPSGERTR